MKIKLNFKEIHIDVRCETHIDSLNQFSEQLKTSTVLALKDFLHEKYKYLTAYHKSLNDIRNIQKITVIKWLKKIFEHINELFVINSSKNVNLILSNMLSRNKIKSFDIVPLFDYDLIVDYDIKFDIFIYELIKHIRIKNFDKMLNKYLEYENNLSSDALQYNLFEFGIEDIIVARNPNNLSQTKPPWLLKERSNFKPELLWWLDKVFIEYFTILDKYHKYVVCEPKQIKVSEEYNQEYDNLIEYKYNSVYDINYNRGKPKLDLRK